MTDQFRDPQSGQPVVYLGVRISGIYRPTLWAGIRAG